MGKPIPSLFQLFRRSRYSRTDSTDDSGDHKKHIQRERWAVAALGHVLRHDAKFRGYFLASVCGIVTEVVSVKIEIEPRNAADLEIEISASSPARRYVVVVEAKAGAGLDSKQNPNNSQFAELGGYGWDMVARHTAPELHLLYVVLGHNEDLKLPDLHPTLRNIRLKQASWSTVGNMNAPSDLARELFETLALIGVPGMKETFLKDIRVTKGLGSIADAWEILRAVCDEFGVKEKTTKKGRGYWFAADRPTPPFETAFGVYFREDTSAKGDNLTKLAMAIGGGGGNVCWVGYLSDHEGEVTPAAYFYHPDSDVADRCVLHFESHHNDASYELDGDAHATRVRTKEHTTNDLDFFREVLATAMKFRT